MTIANPLGSMPLQQPKTETGIPDYLLKSVMATSGTITSNTMNDPSNWNVATGPLTSGQSLTAENLNQNTLTVSCGNWSATVRNQPNWLQRILWRALGVTWRDLRPERSMDELRRLK